MYNNKIIPFLCFFVFCTFMSCNSDKSSEQWRLENQAAYDAVKVNPAWKPLNTGDGPTGIYYQNLTPGINIEGECPIETAAVTVNYTGRYYDDRIFDSGIRSTFVVNEVVRGFSATLQQMHIGQRWKVCIPYYLGYGYVGSYTMQGYTTLFFEIELLQINQYPK